MIETIHIENYKSIHSLDVELGRVTVLIGENGSGKSNILEAIALAAAASQDKLDNEFLATRGIRVSAPDFMKSAFNQESTSENIKIHLQNQEGEEFDCLLQNDSEFYSKWEIVDDSLRNTIKKMVLKELLKELDKSGHLKYPIDELTAQKINKFKRATKKLGIEEYLIYSPENTALRKFEKEAQIEPLGVNGEGLYKLLKVTFSTEPEKINIIKEYLSLISWFEDFELPDSNFGDFEILVKDKYIEELENEFYNHKNTNEGFLFLLFYILLLVSNKTPYFFAIDNIDASLNPKLCTKLTETIVELAKKYNKQVILTTHNPAVLDGLNLYDDEQKILIVSRKSSGHTKVKKLKPPRVEEGEIPIKLSEAFLNGMIGGLPKTF